MLTSTLTLTTSVDFDVMQLTLTATVDFDFHWLTLIAAVDFDFLWLPLIAPVDFHCQPLTLTSVIFSLEYVKNIAIRQTLLPLKLTTY